MAPKLPRKSRAAQIAAMRERRLLRTLITDTITEIETYIKDQQQKSLRFKVNSIGLRVERSIASTPSSTPIRLIQPGAEDTFLGVQSQSLKSTLLAEQRPHPQTNQEEWFTLQEWLTRRYGIASHLEDEPDDSKQESLKQAVAAYICHRHRTHFEFWRKTADVDKCLNLLEQDISSYCKFDLTDHHLEGPSRKNAGRHESESADDPRRTHDFALEIGVHPGSLPFLTWMAEDLETLEPIPLTMADWWKSNGRAFQFLDLPEELRDLVYDQVIGPYICLSLSKGDSEGNQHVRLSRPKRRCVDIHRFGKVSVGESEYQIQPNMLALTCQQMCYEVKKATWERTTALLNGYHHPSICPTWPHIFIPYHAMRRIELNLSTSDYFRFLGLKSELHRGFVELDNDNTPGIAQLREIPTLFHLHLHFTTRPPKRIGPGRIWASLDPWVHIAGARGTKVVSCQKVFVHWFFTLAWADIRHIPRVTFSGHVKRRIRMMWEWNFALTTQDKLRDSKAESIARIQATPWQRLPPICKCEIPCDWWNARGPYLEGQDPNFQPPAKDIYHPDFDPEEFDRFDCMDWDHPRQWSRLSRI
ncbi:hypothetical protein J4E93_010049 [Alternaria ventricosa]|uniref:uncharacterized protein n=1 Tax=Alternaria ventricosa TaxID=1187951 RepID=UPI0020C2389D|nr:uncharacterized protein J4E93_010049 [Alternaria ventricosa]KAI4638494.1 hypothetical protein J4E93_010049 [Alternaria ventricosa]